MQSGSGDLVLSTWHIEVNGNVTRISDSHGKAGEISDNAMMSPPSGALSAVNGGSGMKLIGWRITTTGAIERMSDSEE